MFCVENDRIGIKVYVEKCMGSGSERWIDSVSDCWKKIGLDVGQASIIVPDRNEW